jgi:hypothetical protein
MFRSKQSRNGACHRGRASRRLQFEALEARFFLSATGLEGPVTASPATIPAPHVAALPATPAATALAPDVTVPTDFAGTALSSSSVELTWTADGSALGYSIYEFENGQPVQIAQTNGSTGIFGVAGLAPNTTYAFNLVAFDSTSSGATAWIGVTTLSGLSPPTNFIGTSLSDTQVQLNWTDSAGATGYNLFEFENGQPTLIDNFNSTTTSATVSSLMPNTTYAFNLVAFDTTDAAATPWIAVSTAALVPPANFSGTALSSTQVQLSWTDSVAATGYNLYEFEGGVPVLVATYGAGATSGTINGLTPSTKYAFNLVAFNATMGAATSWIGVTTLSPLTPPANFSGNGISSSQVNLHWSIASGATGYNLYEFEAGAPVLIGTFDVNTTSDIVSGLMPSTTYAFNLVAFNSTQSAATNWIGVSTTA